VTKKPKMTKVERRIHLLEQLLRRREREIASCNKSWQEEINRIQRKNRMTQFQIDCLRKGEWPL
jgi:hypothetical protein